MGGSAGAGVIRSGFQRAGEQRQHVRPGFDPPSARRHATTECTASERASNRRRGPPRAKCTARPKRSATWASRFVAHPAKGADRKGPTDETRRFHRAR